MGLSLEFERPVRRTSSRKSGFVSSTKYVLDKPAEVNSAREKILYVLWASGELAYYKIRLYTDLKKEELDPVLAKLLNEKLVIKTRSGIKSGKLDNTLPAGTYKIV